MLAILKWLIEPDHPRDLYDLNKFSKKWYISLFVTTGFAFFFPRLALIAYIVAGVVLAAFQREMKMRSNLRKEVVEHTHFSVLEEFWGNSSKLVEMAHKLDRKNPLALLCQYFDARYLIWYNQR